MNLAIDMGMGFGQFAGAAVAAGIGIGGAAYFSPWVWRQQRMERIRRQVAESRVMALTYDDGPSSTVTPEILDLLRRRGVHATFFMLGCNAQQYPEIVDRVISEGH